jgi:hypothetical protein
MHLGDTLIRMGARFKGPNVGYVCDRAGYGLACYLI